MKIIFTVLLFFYVGFVIAQADVIKHSRHRLGYNVGFGFQTFCSEIPIGLDVEYTYNVFFNKIQYYFALLVRNKSSIDLLIQPQFNFATYKFIDKDKDISYSKEVGVNVGLLYRHKLIRNFLAIYGVISAGPHHITGSPSRQVPGFIFSDNCAMGLNIQLVKGVYIDFRTGFRHISNAGLMDPNGGVNNITLDYGLFVEL